jgi:hypothetical protein
VLLVSPLPLGDHPLAENAIWILLELLTRQTRWSGQVIWDATPIDLFSYDAFQVAAGAARQSVPFADTSIPIVASSHLIVCKVIFNRPRDWVDVDAMLGGGSRHRCGRGLALGGTHRRDENPRYNRIGAVLTWT